MAARLYSFRTVFNSNRISGCALAALSVLSANVSPASAWVSSGSISNFQGGTLQQQNFGTMKAEVPSLALAQFVCLNDNYGYLIHDHESGQTAAVDTPCANTYKKELESRGWKLTHIFNTHHHWDHTGGNLELKADGVKIIGPKNEKEKIPGLDQPVAEGDVFDFAGSQVVVMDAGGHTKGHVAFYFPDQSKVFVGDCLFSLGCGKMFEGTPEQFWSALDKLRALPDDTLVYCAHEYTSSNAKFALSVEPNNADLVNRVALVRSKRQRDEPTVPTLLGEEKKANPFLRVDFSEEIRNNIGVTSNDTPAQAFGKLRKAKDNFR